MKKILFLLLSTCAMYGQIVPTGQEQDFDYGIKNTASQLDDNAVFITVQNSDGVQGKSTSSVWAKKIYVDNADVKKAFLSTGLIKNGLVQANADPTKFNITAGIGIISNFDDPENPTSTIVNFPAFTGITPTYLTTSNITYVAINSSSAVVMQASPFTNIQRRDLIILGAVIHSNLSTINLVNNISAPTNAGINQLHDLMEAIGALNISGNKYAGNGNLTINKSAGVIFKLGVNFASNWKDPNNLYIAPQTALTFRYRTQNGTEGLDITNIDPSVYDLNNVLTAVPVNRFSIQTVTLFQTGQTRIQYGQTTYATMAEAEAAIITRAYNVESNIAANGITRAYIIVRHNATDLLNTTTSKIIEAQKFGGVASVGVALTDSAIIAALGFTPENVANKSNNYTVSSSTTYASTKAVVDGLATKQNILTNPVTGTGNNNFISKWTGTGTQGNSQIYDNGTNIGFFTTSTLSGFDISDNTMVLGSDTSLKTRTDGVVKSSRILRPHTLTAQGLFTTLFATGSEIRFGGGTGAGKASNIISFWTATDEITPTGSERMRVTGAGRFLLGTTTDDGVNMAQIAGSTKTTALTLTTTPTTSAGTYDILTRNSSTGVVEKITSASVAPIASPAFTGTPIAPTATVGTNTTQIATTAFVQANTNANAVLLTGNQYVYGNKNFDSYLGFSSDKFLQGYNNGIRITRSLGLGAGVDNIVLGNDSMSVSTTGNGNVVVGTNSFGFNYSGDYNCALGQNSMANIVGGGASFSHNQGTFIGAFTKPLIDGGTNEIVIGYAANGNGNNTATLGNDSIIKTVLKGVINTPKTYTVATLPTGILGDKTIVTDATAPTYLGTLTGGGSVVCPVFYNGTSWVSH